MGIKSMSHYPAGSNPAVRALLRLALPAATITLALAVEVSVIPHLHLPAAGPDLVLLVVLGFAAVWGAEGGALVGFAAGLALDLAPPSVGAIGRHAFILALVGALAGRAGREVRNSALRTCFLAGLYAGAAVLGNAVLGTLLGDGTGLGRPGLIIAVGAAALYTAVATPLIVPGIVALGRRTASPGARVLAPAGNALGSVAYRSGSEGLVAVYGAPVRPDSGDLASGDSASGDPELVDLSPRGTRRTFQHPEAG